MNKKGLIGEIVAFLMIAFVIIGVVFVGICLNGVGASHGKHTGYVTAVEFNENILWDSNIVYFKTDTESTQEDVYCVNDKTVKAQLDELAKQKAHITIEYKHPFWFWRSLCNGGESVIVGYEKTN